MNSLKILVVDDDRDLGDSLAFLLEVEGYQVEQATSGEQALRKFRGQEFDATLMDVKLPGMNGIESFHEIRKLKPDAKVMMMTGYSVEPLLRQAMDAGALGVLHKPFDPKELLRVLDAMKPRR